MSVHSLYESKTAKTEFDLTFPFDDMPLELYGELMVPKTMDLLEHTPEQIIIFTTPGEKANLCCMSTYLGASPGGVKALGAEAAQNKKYFGMASLYLDDRRVYCIFEGHYKEIGQIGLVTSQSEMPAPNETEAVMTQTHKKLEDVIFP